MPVLLVIVIFCSQSLFKLVLYIKLSSPKNLYGQQINEYVLPGENCVLLLVFALIRWYHLKRTFCFCQFLHWSSGITALVRWYHLKRTVRFCQFLHWSGGITGRELFLPVFAPRQMVLPEETVCFCQILYQVRWYHLKRTGCFCQFLHWSCGLRPGQTPSLSFQQPWRKDAKTEAWSVVWCLYVQGIICCSAILL